FFFKEDQTRTLESRVEDLSGILFQAKLGTMKEKTYRIQALAEMIAATIAPEQLALVSRAAFLSKADLLSEMVNEFPSLQGAMGRDYARLNGEAEEVAIAIHEHYMPVRAGSQLPGTVIGAIVSIADRIDTIAGCFGIGQIPSGSADPFGLRRQALGLIHIIEEKAFSLSLSSLVGKAYDLYTNKLSEDRETTLTNSINFIKGRFTNDQTAQNIPPGAVEAVTSIIFDDIVDGKQRINALLEVSKQESFPLLAGSFKRVMNIIKEQHDGTVNQALLSAEAEKELYSAYLEVSGKAQPLIDSNAYLEALSIILQMKEPIDIFFDKVMVMTDKKDIRDNRLALLSSIAALFLQVGDFSKMSAVAA
nr:glycine--tRNA ligase subunit beta [Desulfobulbaceae bacterium]